MGHKLSEAESLDYRLHHHASALDNMQVGPADAAAIRQPTFVWMSWRKCASIFLPSWA
jgi:hypothetical protein